MRLLGLLVAALALAGCSEPATPTPTPFATPTPTAPPEPTPSPEPTPPPPEPTPTPEPPPAPPPRVVANQSFDFNTEGDPTGRSPRERPTDRVPEGYATIVVNVTLQRASAAPTQLPVSGSINAPMVRVFASDGTEVVLVSEEGTTESRTIPATVGPLLVRYEGSGTMRANVLITAFP